MNKIKFSHIVFTLALIAAFAVASVPLAPAHALSNSSANVAAFEKQFDTLAFAPHSAVVCKSVTIWRNGHRIVVRRCYKVTKPTS
jgi:hypothetical protein